TGCALLLADRSKAALGPFRRADVRGLLPRGKVRGDAGSRASWPEFFLDLPGLDCAWRDGLRWRAANAGYQSGVYVLLCLHPREVRVPLAYAWPSAPAGGAPPTRLAVVLTRLHFYPVVDRLRADDPDALPVHRQLDTLRDERQRIRARSLATDQR